MMRHWFRTRSNPVRHGGHRGHGPGGGSGRCCARPLSDFAQDAEVTVIMNADRKTLEMGLCTGATVRIVENRPGDANMVIAAGEGRYILAKDTAAKIRVR